MSILDIVLCVAVAVLSWTTYAGWTYRRALTSRTWTDTGVSDLSGEGDLTWTLDPAVCDETDWVEYRRTPTAPHGDEALAKKLGLGPQQRITLAQSVGYPK